MNSEDILFTITNWEQVYFKHSSGQAIKVAARRSLEDNVMCHTQASKYSLTLFELELNRVSLSHC